MVVKRMGNFKSVQIENVGIFDLIFPVGSIYQTMSSDFNPSFIVRVCQEHP